jgi:hypothetical protein
MEMLTSYMDWLVQRFKDNVKVNKSLKDYMKDLLLTNMKVDHDNNSDFDVDVSAKNQNVVFEISGYLIHRFVKNGNYCHECHQTMEVKLENLPVDFTAHFLTKTKSREKLRYSSPKLFELLKRVEFYVLDFCAVGDIIHFDSFRDILYTLCVDKLPKVGCPTHFLKLMSNIIYDFLVIRYKYVTKQMSDDLCGAIHRKKHAHSKLSKL